MEDPRDRMKRVIDEAKRCAVAHKEMGAAASRTAHALSGLLNAAAAGDEADIAAHPDLAYLDLQTRGFYD